MKRVIGFLLAVMMMLTTCAFAANNEAMDAACAEPVTARKLIIDSDMGGDDAMAIMMAAMSPNVEILGITVTAGNVPLEQGMANALQTVEVAGKDIPVYPGATTTLNGIEKQCFSVFGQDGMGDQDLIHPTGKPQTGSAMDFIAETVNANPGEVEIMCLGPVTDMAMTIQQHPEIVSKIKRIWVMGTAGIACEGNATPVAEFNTYLDAEAMQVLFEAEIPMTILGLNVCNVVFSPEQLDELESGSAAQAFVSKAERGYLQYRKENENLNSIDLYDQLAMACFLWDDYLEESVLCAAACIADDTAARGLVIYYQEGKSYDSMPEKSAYRVEVITRIKADETFDRISEALK